jgi:hypothetical protein
VFAIVAEDESDVNTVTVLIRRLKENMRLPIQGKGYSGCAELLRKGANQLKRYAELGATKFIIVHDADGPDASIAEQKVRQRIISRCGLQNCCAVIPVQELEAWILADVGAVANIFERWQPDPIASPERIESPKEYLKRLSLNAKKRPRYLHSTHNEQVALYLDLPTVRRKCPSFVILADFVTGT